MFFCSDLLTDLAHDLLQNLHELLALFVEIPATGFDVAKPHIVLIPQRNGDQPSVAVALRQNAAAGGHRVGVCHDGIDGGTVTDIDHLVKSAAVPTTTSSA